MSNIKLAWMADELRAAGLTVEEAPGWETRTMASWGRVFDPKGVANHHTVGVGYVYPYTFLHDKCNLLIRRNGNVVTVNAGYAYDSGAGTPVLLDKVVNDTPWTWGELAGLPSTRNMNPHFIDIEVEHLGDGSFIPAVQYNALLVANRVLCAHYGWDPMTRVVGHYEIAPTRKIDPWWTTVEHLAMDKYTMMPIIRTDTKEGTTMITSGLAAAELQRDLVELGYDLGTFAPYAGPYPYWYEGSTEFPPGADGDPGSLTLAAAQSFATSVGCSPTLTEGFAALVAFYARGGADGAHNHDGTYAAKVHGHLLGRFVKKTELESLVKALITVDLINVDRTAIKDGKVFRHQANVVHHVEVGGEDQGKV